MKFFRTFFLHCLSLVIGVVFSGVSLAQVGSDFFPVKWMVPEVLTRGELVEAIASEAGLSKADAKRALDGFVNATTHALSERVDRPVYCWGTSTTKDFNDPDSDGDGFSTDILFGVFSSVSGPIGANGCPQPNEVVFQAGSAFSAPDNPLAVDGMEWVESAAQSRAIPPSITALEVTAPSRFYGGPDQILSFGLLGERASFQTGDGVCVFDDAGIVARATVAGVLVEARRGRFQVVDSTDSGGVVIGLLLGGVNPRDVRPGMLIAQCPLSRPPQCEDPIVGFDDDDLIASIVRETRLPFDTAALALTTLYATIVDIVNNGGVVDLEGFGRFEAETLVTAKIVETRSPPLVVIDVWEQSASLVGATQLEIEQAVRNLEQQAKRRVRTSTGRNPQTGKEIKIAAKNVVRFKAGADLSKSVN